MNVLWAATAGVRHTAKAVAEGLLLIAILAAVVLGAALLGGSSPSGADAAFAARGGNGNGGSALWIEASALRDDGSLHFGQDVMFGYRSDTAQSIQLQCFVDGGLVFGDARMLFEGGVGYGEAFVLGPSLSWTEGAADCSAQLGHRSKNGRYVVETTLGFAVAP